MSELTRSERQDLTNLVVGGTASGATRLVAAVMLESDEAVRNMRQLVEGVMWSIEDFKADSTPASD